MGTLALQAITSAPSSPRPIALNPSPACAPAGTTGRTLQLTLTDTAPTSLPASQLGTYCYYAGNGANGAPAGALCQRFTPAGGTPGSCRNLLGRAQPELVGRTGQAAGVVLVRQTSPANRFCPQNTAATDVNGATVAAAGAIATASTVWISRRSTRRRGKRATSPATSPSASATAPTPMTFMSTLMRRN